MGDGEHSTYGKSVHPLLNSVVNMISSLFQALPPKEPTLPQNTERPQLFTEQKCKMGHSTSTIKLSSGEKSTKAEQF